MDAKITVRPATADDYETTRALFEESDVFHLRALPQIFRQEVFIRPLEFVEDRLADENAVALVAERGGRIVGLVYAEIRQTPDIPVLRPATFVQVGDVVVEEGYRGIGVGRALMAALERWAADRDLNDIRLNVWDFNRNAMRFYLRLGYGFLTHTMKKDLG